MKTRSQIIRYVMPLLLLISGVIGLAQAEEYSKGVLWEVSGAGQDVSYLLGTVHSDDPDITAVPAEIQAALLKSRSFSAELDLSLSAMMQAQMMLLLPDDKDLKTLVGQRNYTKAVELMAGYGMPEMIVARMRPWAVAAQLMMPKPATGVFLDLKLYQQAQSKGLQTYGLETIEEQTGVFDSLTARQQVKLLEQAIRDHKKMPSVMKELLRLYKNRDLAGLQRYSEQQMQQGDPELAAFMEKGLINRRNHLMVERMQPRLKEGAAFIAVGALHLPGEQGILRLLAEKGYRLKSVY